MEEPGLDLQYWETRWAELGQQFADDPAGALVEAADFVESMLSGFGHDVDRVQELDEVAEVGEAGEIVADYRAAREVADAVERGDNLEEADVRSAYADLYEIYRSLSVLEDEGVADGPDDAEE